MMKNSLALNDNSVKVVKPTITFTEYETLIKQSQQVADYIDSITLTEENVKDVKNTKEPIKDDQNQDQNTTVDINNNNSLESNILLYVAIGIVLVIIIILIISLVR